MQFPGIGGESPSRRTKTESWPELEAKTKKVCDKFGDATEAVANEPTLALYRVQEHARKSLPTLAERRIETRKQRTHVEGMTYDIDYAARAVKTMRRSDLHFQNIQDLLKNSMFMLQQLEYQAGKRKKHENNEGMYSRPQLRMSRPYSVNDLPFGIADGSSSPVMTSSSSKPATSDSPSRTDLPSSSASVEAIQGSSTPTKLSRASSDANRRSLPAGTAPARR